VYRRGSPATGSGSRRSGAELKAAVSTNLDVITETMAYGLLVDNNEGSALTISAEEAHANLIAAQVVNEKETRAQVRQAPGEQRVLRRKVRGRRPDPPGSSKKPIRPGERARASGMIRAVYSGDRLDVERSPIFTMKPYFDFYVLDGQVFVRNKKQIEPCSGTSGARPGLRCPDRRA
jgi:hypothetical protein